MCKWEAGDFGFIANREGVLPPKQNSDLRSFILLETFQMLDFEN